MSQITANGIQLEVETHGEPGHPSLVLIRGLGTQMIDWQPSLVQGLAAAGLHVVTFDNRDVGLSQQCEDGYDLTDMALDVVGLLDALGIDKAHLFGISMGGMIAQLLAALHGERVISMMSVMSSAGRPRSTPEAQATLTARPDPASGMEGVIALAAEGLRICGSPGYPESLETRLDIIRRRYARSYTPQGVARQYAAVVRNGDRTELLKQVTVPTLVIHGTDDPLILPVCGEETARAIAGSELKLIPGMGHNIPETLVPVLLPIIVEFCQRHS